MPEAPTPQVALGKAIRDLRVRKGLSQEELAHRADVHPTYISYVENGHRNIGWATLHKIARGLDVTMAELADTAHRHET